MSDAGIALLVIAIIAVIVPDILKRQHNEWCWNSAVGDRDYCCSCSRYIWCCSRMSDAGIVLLMTAIIVLIIPDISDAAAEWVMLGPRCWWSPLLFLLFLFQVYLMLQHNEWCWDSAAGDRHYCCYRCCVGSSIPCVWDIPTNVMFCNIRGKGCVDETWTI